MMPTLYDDFPFVYRCLDRRRHYFVEDLVLVFRDLCLIFGSIVVQASMSCLRIYSSFLVKMQEFHFTYISQQLKQHNILVSCCHVSFFKDQ